MIEEGSPGLMANAVGASMGATNSEVIDGETADCCSTFEDRVEPQAAATAKDMQAMRMKAYRPEDFIDCCFRLDGGA